ncbi:hypothetical protein JB92DRAFT_1742776 [Gautieria morchelliformis]|nr:hypothetical protein JB92DRAFT_1742776 [Gautieria morchelliformis]
MGHFHSQPRASFGIGHQNLNTHLLPSDIIFLILEAAYSQSYMSGCERRAGLRAACLVSVAWVHPAQQLLWRSIDIQTVFQTRALRKMCESRRRGSELALYTRKLSVSRRADSPPELSPTMRDIARLLKRLPRVEELHLWQPLSALPVFPSFDLELAITRRPDIPVLTTLHISFARPSLVHNLLHTLPCLRFVAVQSSLSSDTEEDERPPSGLAPRCRLYEIRWGVKSGVHITHALEKSSDTLRILGLHSLPPAFATLMSTHGVALRSLRVFRYDPSLPQAVRHCRVLEEFIMQDHVPPDELLDALPPTLMHLAIDCDYGHQRGLQAVATWVKRRRGRLHVLTCFSPDYDDLDWSNFVRACKESRVELRCFKDWHV